VAGEENVFRPVTDFDEGKRPSHNLRLGLLLEVSGIAGSERHIQVRDVQQWRIAVSLGKLVVSTLRGLVTLA